MTDPRLDRLAEVVVTYCAKVKPGDLVTIVGEPGAMHGVEAIYAHVLRAGGHPSYHARSEALQEVMLRHGSDGQVRHVCPFEAHRLERCDVLIVLIHPVNTRFLSRADPARIAAAQGARAGLLASSLERLAQGDVRYVATEIPSQAAAQDAGMSLVDYESLLFRAGFLHLPDPVASWRALHEQSERAINWLSARRELRFRVPPCPRGNRRDDGTDLSVDISGMTWLNHSGVSNFPDGEMETGPRGADGIVCYNLPAAFKGQAFEGIRLEFRGGRVEDASAAVNEHALLALLDQDPGARVMGEIALGTNSQIGTATRNAFLDEKILGTFHAAVGAGFPQTGNTNRSGLHWDMVCDLRPGGAFSGSPGGTVHADGELVMADGRFVRQGWPGT